VTTIRARIVVAALGATALAGSGCGAEGSDGGASSGAGPRVAAEQEIRAVVLEFQQVRDKRQYKRACALLTARAAAQLTALVGGGAEDCEDGLRRGEPEDDPLTAAQIAKASITVRGDRAVFSGRKDGPRTGLLEVDGDWRLDNILNASLEERKRQIDPRLSDGSDEQQVRATSKAVAHALRAGDYEEMCDLFGYGAEAQLFITVLFTAFDEGAVEPADGFSCVWAVRRLAKLAGDQDEFLTGLLTDAQLDAARITIRGDRATVHVPGVDPEYMVRQDGRWLVGPDPDGFS
jgi:hypothetical protein